MIPITILLLICSALTSNASAANAVIYPGAKVTFYATADGTPAPVFQWRKDGKDIPGATDAIYVIPVFGSEHNGQYVARASNVAGSADSAPEGVFMNQPAPKNVRVEAEPEPKK